MQSPGIDPSANESSSSPYYSVAQHHPTDDTSSTNLEHSKRELHATYVLRRAEAIEATGTTRQHLEDEDDGWKEVVRRCATAAASVQANADLKLKAYELRVSYLEEQLALEQAENSRLIVSNETLRKQVQDYQASADTIMSPDGVEDRALTAEHHLNQLVATRNQAVKEAAALKRKFLQHACEECRMNLKSKTEPDPAAPSTTSGTPSSARRPTYQSSARQVLDNLPKHSSPARSPLKDAKKRKSTIETGAENGDSNDSDTAAAIDPGKTEMDTCGVLVPPPAIVKPKADFKTHAYVGTYGRGPFRFGR